MGKRTLIMKYMTMDIKQGIHILTLTNVQNGNDNTLTTEVLDEYLQALDEVELYQKNTSLVITCEHEKTFSTGINLDWLNTQSATGKQLFSDKFNLVLCRLALLNVPTVACINGNAYAGGAILASAADYRVMRSDRGRFCFPEVNIKIPFSPITREVVKLLPNEKAINDMVLTGVAYTGIECLDLNLVRSIHLADELQDAAIDLAVQLADKDRHTYCHIRNGFRSNIASHASRIGIKYIGEPAQGS
ncbi:MAG TPA: enoyl-CoA hydratase/isomerase family protein [Porticoccaceae bacterium]|jgi:enoyl-CoA hydratase/carnithine racemase|nr:enoyl-CoA hydratase/isomerase family protein [Porticoccaceae bacterium]